MIAGIDYSLSSPCMCLLEKPDFSNAKFYFLTDTKKYEGSFYKGQITGTLHKEYYSEQERYDNIADYFVNKLPTKPLPNIFIEDYSFGSTGKVFHIAENCGHLKYKLWEVGYKYSLVPPTVVKKFASGKGNSKKEDMYEAFVKATGEDIKKYISGEGYKLSSPITDIVDAYYIALYGYHQTNEKLKT